MNVGLSHLIISPSQTLSLGLMVLLGCANGSEIGPGEVVTLLPISPGGGVPDASAEGGSEPEAMVLSVPEENDSAPPSNAGTPAVVAPPDTGVAPPDAGRADAGRTQGVTATASDSGT